MMWAPDGWDLLTVLGLGALCYGLYLLLPAAAFVVGGLIVMAFGVFGASTKGKGGD
jgi:hypothetical protein